MSCGCETNWDSCEQRRVLSLALILNATMFVGGLVAGVIAQSTGLIADSLDMLADAPAYAVALSAVNRGSLFKARAATVSGSVLLALGIGVLLDAVRRGVLGSSPESGIMMAVAAISLPVNATVLYLPCKYRDQEVHLRATWIFTRVDVIANVAVILSWLTIPHRISVCRSNRWWGNWALRGHGRVGNLARSERRSFGKDDIAAPFRPDFIFEL